MLVLFQADARAPFSVQMLEALRSVIASEAREPVSVYVEFLDRARFTIPGNGEELHRYLSAKYGQADIGVIVGFGNSTLEFMAPMRSQEFRDVPMVFGQVEESTYRRLASQPNTTGHVIQLSLFDMITAAHAVVPELKRIALVGARFETQTIFSHFKDQLPQAAKDLEVIDLTGLALPALLERVAHLPGNTAILYTAIYSDGLGTYLTPYDGIKLVAEKANRPVIGSAENFFGTGMIGGYVMMPRLIGENAARLALRILNGETADSIPVTRAEVVRPVFDLQQINRWGVKANALPPGSEIRTPVDDNRNKDFTQISTAGAVALIICIAIVFSVREYRKRRHAEEASRQRMSELAFVNRHATAGEMSAAIAHELNQPLGTILNDAEAAEIILNSSTPDLEAIKTLLAGIRRSDKRASDIIKHLRALMAKNADNFVSVDINEIARQAVEIGQIPASASRVTLHLALSDQKFRVRGDAIQLQQVVLNLVMNGIDAVKERPVGRRDIVVSTSKKEGHFVEVSVSDSGTGIVEENLDRIFDPFFSTKQNGMGVGLSLSRTIIEAHNGLIRAVNGFAGGAVFRFQLPLVMKGVKA